MNQRPTKTGPLNAAELEALSREFERANYSPQFAKAPRAEQSRHDRVIRQAKNKRGRPRIGKGAERIQITVERTLLAQADTLARRRHISRSELIARGLRLALAS